MCTNWLSRVYSFILGKPPVFLSYKKDPPIEALIITDTGLQGYDLASGKELIINWDQAGTDTKIKFYKVTNEDTCMYQCLNTKETIKKARENGTLYVTTRRHSRGVVRRGKAFNIDALRGTGGGISNIEELSCQVGFGCLLPCYLLQCARVPSKDYNRLEISGSYNNHRVLNNEINKFKFELHALQVNTNDIYNGNNMNASADSIYIHQLLTNSNFSSTQAEALLIDMLETKRYNQSIAI